MLKKTALLALAVGMTAGAVYADNNIVKTLQVRSAKGKTEFFMKNTGFVQISNVKTPELTFTDAKGKSQTVKVRNNKALLKLVPGKYSVNAVDVKAKKIGENNFYSVVGKFGTDEMATIPTDGRTSGHPGMFLYNWNYLRKNILEPFCTITLGSAHAPEIDEWRAEGRLVFRNCSVTIPFDEPKRGVPFWHQLGGDPLVDGIGPDEFIVPAGRKDPKDAALGYNNPGRGFTPEHLAAIKEWNKKYPEKSFYAWVGIPWNGDCTAIASLHEAVISNPRGAILWESYLNGKDADKGIQSRYLDRGAIFKAASGGSLKNYIMAPATYEYMDNNGAVDFKVFLDQQFRTVATNPVFADVRGFSMWVAYYTEPEILRWFSKLVQHYGVDGEKTLLSAQYGYKLYPGILKAHNWENAKDWKLSGGASLMAKKDANIKQGYIPYTSVNFLRMELGAGKKPAATQVLTGLKPGKLYSIKTQFCTPDNPAKSDIKVDIKLENAEIIDVEKRFLEDFTRRAPHIWNVRKVIFRAGKKPVKLVITEGEGAAASTVIVDSVQAAPYFTE